MVKIMREREREKERGRERERESCSYYHEDCCGVMTDVLRVIAAIACYGTIIDE
jgi:hypothetical protein